MKNRLLPLMMLSIFFFIGVLNAQIVQDAGFEEQTTSELSDPWSYWVEPGMGGDIEVELNAGQAHSGENNLKITGTADPGGWVGFEQELAVALGQNKTYLLTIWIKLEDNIYWGDDPAWSQGYLGVAGFPGEVSLGNDILNESCPPADEPGELIYGCGSLHEWRQLEYYFDTEDYVAFNVWMGCWTNNSAVYRVDDIEITDVTGIEEKQSEIPAEFALNQNYPNPFSRNTRITFSVPRNDVVKLSLFDLTGRRVRTLANHRFSPGIHSVKWDGKDDRGMIVSSGVYLYRLEVGQYSETKKLTFIR